MPFVLSEKLALFILKNSVNEIIMLNFVLYLKCVDSNTPTTDLVMLVMMMPRALVTFMMLLLSLLMFMVVLLVPLNVVDVSVVVVDVVDDTVVVDVTVFVVVEMVLDFLTFAVVDLVTSVVDFCLGLDPVEITG